VKLCSRCGKLKPTEDFYRNRSRPDGFQHQCKACHDERLAGRRRAGNPARQASWRRSKAKTRMAVAVVVFEYLLTHPCVDCESTDPLVLEFDHVPERGPKLGDVSVMVSNGRPIDVVMAEVAKCDVRCRNCHQKRTHQVNNSWRHQLWREWVTAS